MGFIGGLFGSHDKPQDVAPPPGQGPTPGPPPSMGFQGSSYAPMTSYQQGLTGFSQQGLNQGMGMANQSYNKLGDMGQTFMDASNHADDPNYNPAIGQFRNQTQQNMMNVASALASQRGTSQNPGLAARNIGNMGAQTQQQAVNQMSSLVGQYKSNQMQNALGAYQAQGNMAGVYGQIANALAQAQLTNQGQILAAIAAQNAANVQMQSNINSNNVAMQGNINQMNAGMFGMGLNYNANIFGSQVNAAGNQNMANNQMTGGILSGISSLAMLAMHKGGQVPEKKDIPKYANGGRIPEPRRRKMADGGAVGGGQAQSPDHMPQSLIGQWVAQYGKRGFDAGGQVGQFAPGPMLPNLGLAGSPDMKIAMPPTGLPMGNSQTRGGNALPGLGTSGGMPQPGQQQRPQMAQGGQVKMWGGGNTPGTMHSTGGHGGGAMPPGTGGSPGTQPAPSGGFTPQSSPFQNGDYLSPGFENVGSSFQGNPWGPTDPSMQNQGAVGMGFIGNNPNPPGGGGGDNDGGPGNPGNGGSPGQGGGDRINYLGYGYSNGMPSGGYYAPNGNYFYNNGQYEVLKGAYGYVPQSQGGGGAGGGMGQGQGGGFGDGGGEGNGTLGQDPWITRNTSWSGMPFSRGGGVPQNYGGGGTVPGGIPQASYPGQSVSQPVPQHINPQALAALIAAQRGSQAAPQQGNIPPQAVVPASSSLMMNPPQASQPGVVLQRPQVMAVRGPVPANGGGRLIRMPPGGFRRMG